MRLQEIKDIHYKYFKVLNAECRGKSSYVATVQNKITGKQENIYAKSVQELFDTILDKTGKQNAKYDEIKQIMQYMLDNNLVVDYNIPRSNPTADEMMMF